ncbi:uncharacterized protein TNCV_2953091 [Trichonephila clavipes]|nr:uncharacterized protein TNCV_2953091 [Trichonephila clavipes]
MLCSPMRAVCLGACDGRILIRRSGQLLQTTFLWPRHKGPAHGVMVWEAIFYDSRNTLVVIPSMLTENLFISLVIQTVELPRMSITQGSVFQQDNVHRHPAVVTQHAL